jgi:type IV fimbrial biogenesis protein FimT
MFQGLANGMYQKGFTFIELCISSVILAFGVMLAMPGTARLEDNVEIRSCVNDIYQLIQHAKALSVSQKKPFWLIMSDDEDKSDWKLILSDNSVFTDGHKLSSIESTAYPRLSVKGSYLDNKMAFYASRGKVSSGNILIQSRDFPDVSVKIISSYGAARVRICAQGGVSEQWPSC